MRLRFLQNVLLNRPSSKAQDSIIDGVGCKYSTTMSSLLARMPNEYRNRLIKFGSKYLILLLWHSRYICQWRHYYFVSASGGTVSICMNVRMSVSLRWSTLVPCGMILIDGFGNVRGSLNENGKLSIIYESLLTWKHVVLR
jgi:hypothetical protein